MEQNRKSDNQHCGDKLIEVLQRNDSVWKIATNQSPNLYGRKLQWTNKALFGSVYKKNKLLFQEHGNDNMIFKITHG